MRWQVAAVAGVVAIAFGWDTGLLTRVSLASTGRLEQALIGGIGRDKAATPLTTQLASAGTMGALPVEGSLPSLDGATTWINSTPLSPATLKGKADIVVAGTLDRAVAEAAKDAEASGLESPVVLLSPACASYDQFSNFEVRGDAFRTLVRKVPGIVVPRGLEPSKQN